jgi:hypothetical protein
LAGGLLIAALTTGCAASGASVDKAIDDYYFPDKAAQDAPRSAAKSEAVLDTIPNAAEIKELNP